MSRLASLLRRVAGRLEAGGSIGVAPATSVGEITPCGARHDPWLGKRLNLVLPSINRRHYFGGIHTAVLIYRELCRFFPASRIILVDSAPDEEALSRFADHTLVPADTESSAQRQIVPFSDRYGKTLPVAGDDIWVATAWWTAYAAQRLSAWQGANGGVDRPMVYLIQDFEPGFYAWSSQYALSLSTYRCDRDVAIFNTGLLADFFAHHGMRYTTASVFEPVLHDGLRAALSQARSANVPRERRIVVYARPGTPRNAFELICEGLRLWGWKDPRSSQWQVAAPGEIESDLDLGPFKLEALGKLDIDAYATLLSTSSIGLSLMVSPHPSYPPLEMAAFGMSVLTNRYDNKRLDETEANIHSLESMTPEAICADLSALVDACEARGMMAAPVAAADHPLLGQGSFDRIAIDVVEALA